MWNDLVLCAEVSIKNLTNSHPKESFAVENEFLH
jgi:hypothetical protein